MDSREILKHWEEIQSVAKDLSGSFPERRPKVDVIGKLGVLMDRFVAGVDKRNVRLKTELGEAVKGGHMISQTVVDLIKMWKKTPAITYVVLVSVTGFWESMKALVVVIESIFSSIEKDKKEEEHHVTTAVKKNATTAVKKNETTKKPKT